MVIQNCSILMTSNSNFFKVLKLMKNLNTNSNSNERDKKNCLKSASYNNTNSLTYQFFKLLIGKRKGTKLLNRKRNY